MNAFYSHCNFEPVALDLNPQACGVIKYNLYPYTIIFIHTFCIMINNGHIKTMLLHCALMDFKLLPKTYSALQHIAIFSCTLFLLNSSIHLGFAIFFSNQASQKNGLLWVAMQINKRSFIYLLNSRSNLHNGIKQDM